MEVRYFDETKKFDFIDNYQQFLEKCYKEFDMSEEEKKSLKIFVLDDEDELTIENEGDFNDSKSSLNDNNELICILKSSGRKPKPKNKEEKKEEVKDIEKKEEKNKEETKDTEKKDEENKEEVKDTVKNNEVSKKKKKKEENNNKDSSEKLEQNNNILGNNQILEEINKLKEELIKKIDDEKKINKKSVQEIKALFMKQMKIIKK